MKKKDLKYYIIIIIILGFTVLYEALKPKPINWSFTLESEDKIPYGTFVLFNTLSELFPENKITVNKKTTYEHRLYHQEEPNNYIYITESFDVDTLEIEALLQTAQNGNHIFIASHYFSAEFQDTLKFQTNYFNFLDTIDYINFYNPHLKQKDAYVFKKSSQSVFFDKIDTLNAEILAHSKNNRACFIRQKFGKGMIYLSSIPELFTNYSMVAEKNYTAAYASLSYLPSYDIIWDEYYKPYRKNKKSMLEIVWTNKSFKVAYILLIITVIFFVFFTAKRRQRIIPIIKPYENKSLQFIKTLGRLYYSTKNHKDIANKKYNYLQHFVLLKYYINFSDYRYEDYNIIGEKTGVDVEIIKKILSGYLKINKLDKISPEDLIIFNNYIEDFYEKCK
jgi:hypothetical protein